MSRKTTSEPDNKVTLLDELKKEFAVYIERFNTKSRRFLLKYPHQVFACMLICMLISGILAFSVMRQQKISVPSGAAAINQQIGSGFGQILSAGSSLKEVLRLQDQINIVLKKDSLDAADSLLLKHVFERLDAIHNQLNPKP